MSCETYNTCGVFVSKKRRDEVSMHDEQCPPHEAEPIVNFGVVMNTCSAYVKG